MVKGQFKDLVGMRFGKLTVNSLHHEKLMGKAKQVVRYWFCICDCGGTIVIRGSHLTAPSSEAKNVKRSCGCEKFKYQRSAKWKEKSSKEGTAFRLCLSKYVQNAKNKNREWSLTEEQFKELTSSPCYYTGISPRTISRSRAGEVYLYNGIDRIDSYKGYTIENCVPCCEEVNRMKMDMPQNKFIEMCKQIAKRLQDGVTYNKYGTSV